MFFDILLDLPIASAAAAAATSGGGESAASAMEVSEAADAEVTSDGPAAKKARTEASNAE